MSAKELKSELRMYFCSYLHTVQTLFPPHLKTTHTVILIWREVPYLQGGVVAASEYNFAVHVDTLHTFVMQLLLSDLGQGVQVPDLGIRLL